MEKRKHRRVPLYTTVDIQGAHFAGSGFTLTVSEGGLSFRVRAKDVEGADHHLKDQAPIQLTFPLPPHHQRIQIQGRMIWRQQGQDSQGGKALILGVAFSPGEGAVQVIRSFVESFRYRILALDFPHLEVMREALEQWYQIELAADEPALLQGATEGHVALLMIGEGNDPAQGLDRLERILAGTKHGTVPPVLYGVSQIDTSVEQLMGRTARVLCHRIPAQAIQLRSAAQRLIETNALEMENQHLRLELESALERLRRENEYFRNRLAQPTRIDGLLGESKAMERVVDSIDRVAAVDSSVLIIGETGTGKNLVAHAIHRLSPRASKSFVSQNCAAVPDTLLDSELFGHSRGAFTGAVADRVGLFESAEGGTIFLDEIAEMSPAMQAKLLHVLQDGSVRRVGSVENRSVNVRVLCATHRNIEELVKARQFREDLYYRLLSFIIRLPPLRDRREDIALLAMHFLTQFASRNGIEPKLITADAIAALTSQPWPGNIRQLQHTMERIAILCGPHQKITAAVVDEALALESPNPLTPSVGEAQSLDQALWSHERQLVTGALERAGWVIADAARALGVNRTTLSKRLRRLEISIPNQVTDA